MKKLVFILPFLLAGCGIFKSDNVDIPVTISTKPIQVDSAILVPCEELEEVSSDIGKSYIQIISQYGSCAKKQSTSIEVIKNLANIKDNNGK